MLEQVVLHDTRLAGVAPAAGLNISVDGTDPLERTLLRIRKYALSQAAPIDLEILCHGYADGSDRNDRQALGDSLGGSGLQLCREGLRSGTVKMTRNLRGVVNSVVLFVCSAAETHPPYVGTNGDGQRLFREMAANTDATVFAVDATRWYWHLPAAIANACATVMEFRAFEGYMWRFRPDGSTTIVESNALVAA